MSPLAKSYLLLRLNKMCIIFLMSRLIKHTLLILIALSIVLCASCAVPISAKESEQQRAYYEDKYADEPEPSEKVAEVLDFLETCVGGQYIFGAQGNKITKKYVEDTYKMYESFFSHGRYSYFINIATESEENGHDFPSDYAWDCSGLWWYTCNELGLYDDWTDMTAASTYEKTCTPITKEELRPGDIVFVENEDGHIVHMGIVGTHGYIYEAASSFVGVVKKRTVDNRIYDDVVRGKVLEYTQWNVFGRPKIFE